MTASRLGARLAAAWLGLSLVCVGTAPARAGGRVVAMLVVDTDTHLSGIDVDREGVLTALQAGLKPDELLVHDDMTGKRVTRANVLKRLAELPAGPDDTVFFYYSGHGAVLANVGHALTTSGGDVLRSEVRDAIRAKNPRLAVVLTDCCANVVRRAPRTAPAPQAPAAPRAETPPIRSLLFGHRGVVDILSSDVGESSWCSKESGGFFTATLVQGLLTPFAHDLDLDGDGFVEWSEFFPYLRSRTMWRYREFRDDRLVASANHADVVQSLLRQPNQTPRPVSLGRRDDGRLAGGYDSGNLGVTYQVVQLNDRLGARVIAPPVPGSPAATIGLEPGDLIYEIDGFPIRHFVDVLNHNGRTSLSFVNVRTNRAETRWVDLPLFNRYPPGAPPEHHAPNLGLYYQLVGFGPAMGARLSRYPEAGSPFTAVQLEPGDMLISLDDQPIRSTGDVANHRFRTTFQFVNIRTGLVQSGEVTLP